MSDLTQVLSLRRSRLYSILSLRSRRQNKAWGAKEQKIFGARETGCSVLDSQGLSPGTAGSRSKFDLYLGLARQALCFHLLRRLRAWRPTDLFQQQLLNSGAKQK